MKTTRETRKEATRMSIIDAAIDTLAETGELNMSKIADRVSYSPAAIYRSYFGSQKEIMEGVANKVGSWNYKPYDIAYYDDNLDHPAKVYVFAMIGYSLLKTNPRMSRTLAVCLTHRELGTGLGEGITDEALKIPEQIALSQALIAGPEDNQTRLAQFDFITSGFLNKVRNEEDMDEYMGAYREHILSWMAANGWAISASRAKELDNFLETIVK